MSLAELIPDAAWKLRAACRKVDTAIFFPEKHTGRNGALRAKRICSGCLVRAECLEYALDWPTSYDRGIYAGTTYRERMLMRRQRAA